MNYLVMETHLSYAVVLDEEGRFLRVANMHYEVGQTLTDVVMMKEEGQADKKVNFKLLYSIAAVAACLVLAVSAIFSIVPSIPYASVYVSINPEVRIDINRFDTVVNVSGENADGIALVENYEYKSKELELVCDELVDRAIDMGFLHEGGEITLTMDADDGEWVVSKESTLKTHLNEYLRDKISVTITVSSDATDGTQSQQVVIPVNPTEDAGKNSYGESDYGNPSSQSTPQTKPQNNTDNVGNSNYDTDYGAGSDGVTDYTDTDYGVGSDGVTNYNDTDDGQTDYGSADDGNSPYDTTDSYSDYNTVVSDESQSNYESDDTDSSSSYGDSSSDYNNGNSSYGSSDDSDSDDDGDSNYSDDEDDD